MAETKLELAFRHVVDGRRIVARQRELVAKQKSHGTDTKESECLLAQFERTLSIFEHDLEDLQRQSN